MQQQVNLYQPMFRRTEKKFSAKKLLGLLVGSALFFTAVYGYVRWDVYKLESQLTELENQYQNETRQIEELNKQFPLIRTTGKIEKQLASLRAEREAKRNLIALLQGRSALGNIEGFSSHMEGIARQRVDGMWVTAFQLNDGGEQIGIVGSSLQPELVPKFLQNLSAENSFIGTEFRVFRMQRDKEQTAAIDFELLTTQTDKKAGK
jgi:cell division protein FtsL